MPYIITTTPPACSEAHARGEADYCDICGGTDTVTRTAVATPDELRDYVHNLGADYGAMAHLDCVLDGTSRVPIGPLPDGTVIEVRRVTYYELRQECPNASRDRIPLIEAFNSR